MQRNKRDLLPDEFKTMEEAANFWDTHSLADYEDLQRDIQFEVDIKSEKNYFAVERDLSVYIDNLAHIKILPGWRCADPGLLYLTPSGYYSQFPIRNS